MPQPWRHPKSGVYYFYFRKVVPAPLRATLGRTEFRISLGTKSLREAKLKYPEVAAGVDAKLTHAAGGPASLTQLQITALAGKWYSQGTGVLGAEPPAEPSWRARLTRCWRKKD